MALDKQISLFKVDTKAFLSDKEKEYEKYLFSLRKEKKEIKKKLKENKNDSTLNKKLNKIETSIKKEKKEYKKKILESSKKAVEYNNTHDKKIIRELDRKYLYYIDKDNKEQVNVRNIVSMFESTLSRSFGIKTNELTYDIFIVEVYYYDIAQDLIVNGFNYDNKHYIYFSSSAGQIRTKKTVFVEEEKYKKCQNKLMCGLTIDEINKNGGMNINKFLAYSALSNSATDLWQDVFEKQFDIDKAIVVEDFETMVKCKVDNIDYTTYKITKDVIQDMPIPHTDGCGMILSSYSPKNFMVRLPFIKGLLGSFDFVKFIKTHNCSSVVKDIWGKEYDIIKDDIQIIFTKSQLKMWKYYKDWDDYKDKFKKYDCEAGICNMEEDKISNARINYQMLQSLYKITDDEISKLCKQSNKNIQDVSNSLENMLRFFGVYQDDFNEDNKDSFQKALKIYPELLNDISSREDLKDLKNSLVKSYRGGKLEVIGKFTFVLPDFYAFCEWLFMRIDKPLGLLGDKEVFCRLYKNSKELDCLRSPSLYIEHAIRNNVCNKKYRNQKLEDWFQTDAVYTSTYDLVSRILQFDVDGDKLLVLAQKSIIDIAKKNMEGVNPLYYEMKKAKAETINPKNMYKGLKLAFVGGNIGVISNDITKIWSQNKIDEEQLNAVKWLCMETNFTIDYAKTLFKPKRPKDVDSILKYYHNIKVPHFFVYAKDKIEKIDKKTKKRIEKECKVCDYSEGTIDKISKEIKDTKLMFNSIRNLEPINYLMLLKDKKCEYSNSEINKIYNIENRKYGNNIKIDSENYDKNNIEEISKQIKNKLLDVEPNENNIIQSLVKHLYEKPSSRKKKLLWYMYGDKILENIKKNIDTETEVCMKCGKRVSKGKLVRNQCSKCRELEIKQNNGKKIIKCVDCGKEFEVKSNSNKKIRCKDCQVKFTRILKTQKQREYRKNKKVE